MCENCTWIKTKYHRCRLNRRVTREQEEKKKISSSIIVTSEFARRVDQWSDIYILWAYEHSIVASQQRCQLRIENFSFNISFITSSARKKLRSTIEIPHAHTHTNTHQLEEKAYNNAKMRNFFFHNFAQRRRYWQTYLYLSSSSTLLYLFFFCL